MKITLLVLSVLGAATARPSVGSPGQVHFSQDGRSYSYSYQAPAQLLQSYSEPVFARAHYQPANVIVAPALRYYGGFASQPVQHVQPANIQVSNEGFVLDTPEVAQARAAHLAALAHESSRAGAQEDDGQYEEDTVEVKTLHQQPADIHVSADGHVLDTPEVAQAKADHLAAVAAEKAKSTYNSVDYSTKTAVHAFQHPINVIEGAVRQITVHEPANIQVSADGHVVDTPEVAQARSEHFAAYAAETAKASHQSVQYAAPHGASFQFVQPLAATSRSQFIQPANIQVSSDGFVMDTPEVAQAKAAHLAQYASDAARALAAGGDQSDYSEDASSHSAGVSAASYSAPSFVSYRVQSAPADIRVSADGFVLDTPEVAQAKASHLASLAHAEQAAGVDDGSSNDIEENSAPALAYHAPTAHTYLAYTSPSVAYTSAPLAYSAPAFAQPKWNGPLADIRVGADGYVEDTPEVQQARAEHLATRGSLLASSHSSTQQWSGASSRYAAQLSPGGQYLEDTPEVAAARAAHLAAHQHLGNSAPAPAQSYGQLVYSAPVRPTAAFGYSFSTPSYNFLQYRYAPTVAPVALSPDGQYILDTPEVAQAKAEHFAAHARARGY